MGRPRLHNTEEEKTEAARGYRRAYYARYVLLSWFSGPKSE